VKFGNEGRNLADRYRRREFDIHETDVQRPIVTLVFRINDETKRISYVDSVALEGIDVFSVLRGYELPEIFVPVGNRIIGEDTKRRLPITDGLGHPHLVVQLFLGQTEKSVFKIRSGRRWRREHTKDGGDEHSAESEALKGVPQEQALLSGR
jgi:hypothetical protein